MTFYNVITIDLNFRFLLINIFINCIINIIAIIFKSNKLLIAIIFVLITLIING